MDAKVRNICYSKDAYNLRAIEGMAVRFINLCRKFNIIDGFARRKVSPIMISLEDETPLSLIDINDVCRFLQRTKQHANAENQRDCERAIENYKNPGHKNIC